MQNQQWEDLVDNIKVQFPDAEILEEELDEEFNGHIIMADVVIFKTPTGRFRLVREKRPVVLEKKMLYSHRAGDSAVTEYKLSDTDLAFKVKLYKEDDDDWREVTLTDLHLN